MEQQIKKITDPYGWIKSTDRMPEFNVSVLVFIPEEDHHITSGMWDVSRKWVLLDEYRIPQSEVTYWMPIPVRPLDTTYTPCKYIERSPDEMLRSAQKENFELKRRINTIKTLVDCIDFTTPTSFKQDVMTLIKIVNES